MKQIRREALSVLDKDLGPILIGALALFIAYEVAKKLTAQAQPK